MSTHVDDILTRGESGIVRKATAHLAKRSGVAEIQDTASTQVGMDIAQSKDVSVEIARATSTDALQILPTSTD